MSRLASTIEAILYLKAQPLSIAQISEFAGCDRKTTEEGLLELMGDYAHRDTALEVVDTGKGYTLQLRESYQNLVHALIPADVGVGALRTLAVIAMRGPLTQTDLVDLRGSGAYQHVQELVTQGFVKRRRKSDGRSYWVQVTDKFHQYFQLNQLPEGMSQLISRRKAKPSGEEVTDGEAIALDTSEEIRKDLGAEEPLELDELQLED
ncbi:MAG: SMC-Scp complex subunit ScpB [Myxacorys californica WJT36-NPBG1]|jgi:segregation and condensation protein B|nr:SMC-Scp complex subunit ScpB [Myxacorys californica WJT36-NPBG1]